MKKNCSLFITLLLIQQLIYSQSRDQKIIDSLHTALIKSKEDSNKLKLYAAIMQQHVNYNTKEGFGYQKEALGLAEKLNWDKGVALVKDAIGRLHWRTGNFDEALKNHFEALSIYIRTGNKAAEQNTFLSLGQDYGDAGKYEKARYYLLLALKLSEQANDKLAMASIYDILIYLDFTQGNFVEAGNKSLIFLKINEELGYKPGIAHAAGMLGANFANIENYEEAIKYFKQGLQAVKEGNDRYQEASFSAAIAEVYATKGQFSDGLPYLTAAVDLAREIKDIPFLANIEYKKGNFYSLKGNPEEAIKYYTLAADGFKSVSDKKDLGILYADMGISYTQLREYGKAQKSLDDALSISQSIRSIVPIANYYLAKHQLDSAMGNWKNAYEHYKKFIYIRDSTLDLGNLKKIVGSQIRYDSDKREAIAKVEQEKKNIRIQEELKRQRNIRNSAIAILIIALLFLIGFYYQRNKIAKEKKRSDALLRDKELLLKEIHHRVKNNLEVVSSLLALQGAQIDDPTTRDAMLEGQNRVNSIGIVHQKLYQGENLAAVEMKDYFVHLSESILDSFGAEGRIKVELAMEKLDVDIDTAVPLGLIVNELLTNTLKYAFPNDQTGSVRIKLERQRDNILHLEVSDNGIGKSGSTHGTGFGQQLISLLTRQLNGSMKEEISNGTRVSFDFTMEKVA